MCKLLKALYGLKIGPKRWNKRSTDVILMLDLENYIHEPCLYTWRRKGKEVFLLLYVDNILIGDNDLDKINQIILRLKDIFKLKDLGEPKKIIKLKD